MHSSIYRRLCLGALLTILHQGVALADDQFSRHHVWDKRPIELLLPVGREKRIDFPEPLAEFKIPPAIGEPASRTQLTPDGRLYWLAHAPWEPVRVIAVGETGYHYLFDVAAGDGGEPNPLIIELADPVDPDLYAPEKLAPSAGYDYVDLARHAAQHMFGPSRLIRPLPGVSRLPVKQRALPLVRGANLKAVPVAQWSSPRPARFVTAVRVSNLTDYPVELSPLALRGRWLFAVPHHPTVRPKGQAGDSSFFYLVSDHPFAQAIGTLAGGPPHWKRLSDNRSDDNPVDGETGREKGLGKGREKSRE